MERDGDEAVRSSLRRLPARFGETSIYVTDFSKQPLQILRVSRCRFLEGAVTDFSKEPLQIPRSSPEPQGQGSGPSSPPPTRHPADLLLSLQARQLHAFKPFPSANFITTKPVPIPIWTRRDTFFLGPDTITRTEETASGLPPIWT